jgi:hypothetical protein
MLESFANDSVVVDLTIDCKSNGLICVGKGLGSTLNTNDTQTFVSKNCNLLVLRDKTQNFVSYLCCSQYSFLTNLDHGDGTA